MIDKKNNTLCWKCKKCYGTNQCDWANFLKPIEGWKIVPGNNDDETTRSGDVIYCPEYVRDEKAIEVRDVYCLIADQLELSPCSVQTRWQECARKYQEQMTAEYGSAAQIPQEKKIPEWFWYKDIDRGV